MEKEGFGAGGEAARRKTPSEISLARAQARGEGDKGERGRSQFFSVKILKSPDKVIRW